MTGALAAVAVVFGVATLVGLGSLCWRAGTSPGMARATPRRSGSVLTTHWATSRATRTGWRRCSTPTSSWSAWAGRSGLPRPGRTRDRRDPRYGLSRGQTQRCGGR